MQLKREKQLYGMSPARTTFTKHIIFEYANLLRKLKVASKVILFITYCNVFVTKKSFHDGVVTSKGLF